MTRKAIFKLSGRILDKSTFLIWYKSTPFIEGNNKTKDEFSEFSIYRKQCDDFEFNNDYEEFFCGLQPEESDLIFKGSLECLNNRKYVFKDENIEIGKTYAYFVKSKNTGPVGPVPVKFRNPDVWWSYKKLCEKIEQLKKDFYSKVEISVCGRTVQGRNIYALKIGSGKPFLGLLGAMHPGESGPELIISALRKLLNGDSEILKNRSIVAIPSLNIDVREQLASGIPWYLRKNIAGVDINRNFPVDWDIVSKVYGLSSDDPESMTYRGAYPASEPEVQTVMNFFSENTPECIFSYHALASICDLPGLTAGGDTADNKEFCKCAEAYIYAYGSGLHPELSPEKSWWSTSGTEGSFLRWAYQELNIPAFDMELSAKIAPEALKSCRTDLTDIRLLNEYIERHARAIEKIMYVDKF